ncbi:MAG: hypothetical protein LC776_02445 [Acidobacteria bacterium]|nr:hypothetical protein [Acidobacteriota bacterium]
MSREEAPCGVERFLGAFEHRADDLRGRADVGDLSHGLAGEREVLVPAMR